MIKAWCSYDKSAKCYGTVYADTIEDIRSGNWLHVDDEYTKHSSEDNIEILEVFTEDE